MTPLIETKLRTPRRRPGVVARPRLDEQLRSVDHRALTVVSAPAGFGKTTLLTEWCDTAAATGTAVAWLSLDPRDNDPARFWSYVIAALQTVVPEAGTTALALLHEPQSSIEAVLSTLLNELNACPRDLALVLDDYHVVESSEVHTGVELLLEHLPPNVHLVLATRADPPLPLARLRARGDLVEIRAAQLRFTGSEAAAYLNGSMGLTLDGGEVETLEARTEGWIAALQLAALSMQGRADVGAFIESFAGDDRYIVDYLVGEVLYRQSSRVQDFLLQTSILRRLSGPLCDAVTGQDDGKATLAMLDRDNLFVVQLDDRREWFRYHHLFADVLRARLVDERPDEVPLLHRRASDWFAADGDLAEAFAHALDAKDFDRAATFAELAVPELARTRQDTTLREWLDALPDEVFGNRPVLAVAWVGARMVRGEVEGVAARLHDAERALAAATAPDAAAGGTPPVLVVDHEEFRRLPCRIATYRAGHALILGDVPGTVEHARRSLDLAEPDDHLGRGAASALMGLAQWSVGDLDDARRSYCDAVLHLDRAGRAADALGCRLSLADIDVAVGRLGDALATLGDGLERVAVLGPLRGAADMHVGTSEVLIERNEVDDAVTHLDLAAELGDPASLPQRAYRWRVAMARVAQIRGDVDRARQLLREAALVFDTDFAPAVRPIAAVQARLDLARGDIDAARRWARDQGFDLDDEPRYRQEYELLTLARVLLARRAGAPAGEDLDDAHRLLDRLLPAAEARGAARSAVEILMLRALALQARGDSAAASTALDEALARAAPEGIVRVFVDEAPAITPLLRAAAARDAAPDHARRVLAAIDGRTAVPAAAASKAERLVDELSSRELDVLRLLRSDLSGPDIARELMVSLNTMRTHTKNIYAKLGVSNRREAVRRAAELGL